MIKHIIFDMDGTLVDSLPTIIKLGNEMAEKYGFQPISQDRIKELLKLPMKSRLKELKIPVFKLPKLGVELLNSYHSYAEEVCLFEGIEEMLERLHKDRYCLNIVSSNSVQNIKAFLELNHLNMFANIESSKGLFAKHVTIGRLITKLNIDKSQVIYVGDEQRDIEACKKIGIRVISVLWGLDSHELLESANPDYIVSRPDEIINIVKDIK